VTTALSAFDLYRAGDFDGALRSARVALVDNGENPGLRHLIGVLLCRAGQLVDGAAELEKAVALAPHDIGARVMLVRALIDLKRPGEALAQAKRPAPGQHAPMLWRIRAEAAQAAAALPELIEALRQLIALEPEDWGAWGNLAVALRGAGDLDGALEAIGSARRHHPDRVELTVEQARLLAAAQRFDEAEERYRQILEASPGEIEAVRELGLLLERTNRLDELGALIAEAERAAVSSEQLAYLRARAAWREKRGAEALEWLEQAGESDDPVRAGQLAARLHDSLGNPAAAFAAAERMNRAVPDHDAWRARGAEHRARLRRLAELVTPEWTAGWPDVAPGRRPAPAFLVGFPRSGTTLLDTFLMGHPDVAVIEEEPFFDEVAAQLGSFERLAEAGQDEIDRLRQTYFAAMDRYVPPGFGGLVIDKLPLNLLGAPLIHRLFPDARFIFAQRHPCDSVLSGYMQGFELNPGMASFLDIEDTAELYDVTLEIWTRTCAALPLKVHRFVYEKMVEDPDAALRKLIAFLGLEWRDELLDHRATARGRGVISTPSYDQVTEAVHQRSSGRWRRYEAQMQPALPILLPWARRLGYAD
jgi:tetratricopeptide (TPR) repeat protein